MDIEYLGPWIGPDGKVYDTEEKAVVAGILPEDLAPYDHREDDRDEDPGSKLDKPPQFVV